MFFINLTNGIQGIKEYNLDMKEVRFVRIQSTACEQKQWEQILLDLSSDFLMFCALGENIKVVDYGAKKEIPRAMWQGLEWVKFVLYVIWKDEKYVPVGRASKMQGYFYEQYKCLSRKTKRKLDYYKKFFKGEIKISYISKSTKYDGNFNYYKRILTRDLVPSPIVSRYDDVYSNGLKWLDSLD